MGGYVKLYRKIKNTSVWSDSDKLKLWIYCITEATHEPKTIVNGNTAVKLEKGQFFTGRNILEKEFNKGVKKSKMVSGKTLFRWLELFEKLEMLSIKKTNKFSIVTVTNWDKYQCNDQQVSNKCPTDVQQVSTIKNIKNIKNIKKEINKEKKDEFYTMIHSYTENEKLRKSLAEFVEMRSSSKKDKGMFTLNALKKNLNKLSNLSANDEEKIKIVDQSIEQTWKAFYPLKENNKQSNTSDVYKGMVKY